MIVEVATLQSGASDFDFSIAPEEINLEDEGAQIVSPISVRGKLTKSSVGWNVSGNIKGSEKIECSRCLQSVEREIEFPFRAVFVTDEFSAQGKETELHGEDLEVAVFAGDRIDLKELAREQILLDLPEQIFCSRTCKGLCEKCGANRNLIDCNCGQKEIDPRWAALKNLK